MCWNRWIEAARLAPNTGSLTSLRETLADAFQDVSALSESLFYRSAASRVIITCCASGQGGAVITKQYLEKHLDLEGIDVIPLAIADRKLLIQEINRIREKHQILCLIGMPAFYIEDWGGWSNRKLIDEYVEFARVCLTEYKGLATIWNTFNEINVPLMLCKMAHKTTADLQRGYEEIHNQLVASAKVVQLAHQIDPDNKVGCMCAGFFAYPYTCDPNDFLKLQQEAQAGFYLFSDVFVRGYYPSYAKSIFDKEGVVMNVSEEDKADLAAGKVDYMAFSYYNSSCITTHEVDATVKGNMMGSIKNPYLDASEWGWQIDPVGFKRALHELYDRYQLPLLVIENGLGAQDTLEADGTIHDPYRVDYMKRHIAAMKEAVEEGVDLMGYTMWSCIDLVSAGSGELRKRYGFVYVDAHDDGTGTFKRYRKDSFWWYKKVIESNGEDLG